MIQCEYQQNLKVELWHIYIVTVSVVVLCIVSVNDMLKLINHGSPRQWDLLLFEGRRSVTTYCVWRLENLDDRISWHVHTAGSMN